MSNLPSGIAQGFIPGCISDHRLQPHQTVWLLDWSKMCPATCESPWGFISCKAGHAPMHVKWVPTLSPWVPDTAALEQADSMSNAQVMAAKKTSDAPSDPMSPVHQSCILCNKLVAFLHLTISCCLQQHCHSAVFLRCMSFIWLPFQRFPSFHTILQGYMITRGSINS